MSCVIVHASAKINLSLRVVGKRADGYHLLESHVVFTEYGDVVEVCPAAELLLEIIGEFAEAFAGEDIEKNLVWKAAEALQAYLPEPSGAKITLTKNLPIGSGIGGGSADAAATIRALCQLWRLEIPENELAQIALKLGSDVPVCLYAKSAMMRGIGEEISPAEPPAQKYIVLINPLIPLSTAEVFLSLRGGLDDAAIQSLSLGGSGLLPAASSACSRNDDLAGYINHLQPAAIQKLPIIAELLAAIEATDNCRFAQMSGSGATCFGLYDSENDARSAAQKLRAQYLQMWCINTKLKN